MNIIVFKVSGCGSCVKIHELMERANLNYNSILVGTDMTREEFKEKYPNARGFPYVIIDGKQVGSLLDTVKLFVEKGLVTSKK